MSAPSLHLDPDRLLPAEPGQRAIARRLYDATRALPIISPHGHVDARILAEDTPFPDPAALLITPDHYVTRLLHAHGVPLEALGHANRTDGTPAAPGREVWRAFCQHWKVFRGTPSRYWLEAELVEVFGTDVAPSADTADELFDLLSERIGAPDFRPRALFDRFGLEVLATTDDPADDLAAHRALASDPTFTGRVVPTFRPDRYLHADAPGWPQALARLAEVTGEDTTSYTGFITALEARRAYFKQNGATASDHGHIDAACTPLPTDALADVWAALQAGTGTPEQAAAFRGHMLFEMARMASEDGLVMQLHPGVVRNYDPTAFAAFGPDTGHDIPTVGEYTHALRPMLAAFGNNPMFRIVLFTVDDTVWTREVGPLAGYFPAVYAGAPWWFLDTPDTIARYRAGITDSAGFYKTSGFIDDTRAYCSIPVRHDMARRLDAAFLARLVSEGRLGADEALDTAVDLAHGLPKQVFRL